MPSSAPPSDWRLQDAKAQFSLVVETALRGVPQHVTRRGKRAVVVVSEEDFAALQRSARAGAPGFVEHLLAMPKAPGKQAGASSARQALALRDVDFS